MQKKILVFLSLFFITCVIIIIMIFFEIKNYPVGGSLGGVFAGIIIPVVFEKFTDLVMDTTNWKTSQRKLQRGKIICKDTIIRISFSYLFRIKINGKYFLVKNARGTEKFQPVGGVYKFYTEEFEYLLRNFYCENDNKILIDECSKLDYRLRLKNRYLRKFVKRFNKTSKRENINNLSREFVEEIFETGTSNDKNNFGLLTYVYCGQDITDVKFSNYFQCYELLIADIVEVQLTNDQEKFFIELVQMEPEKYILVSDEYIKSLGVGFGSLKVKISDHTSKILSENEEQLIINKGYDKKKKYTIEL